jgi:hypothetical protein
VYTQVFESCLTAFRFPLTPLKKGGTGVKVPQFIGGFRGIFNDFGFIQRCVYTVAELKREGFT